MKIVKEGFDTQKYYDYLTKHINGVKQAFEILAEHNFIDTLYIGEMRDNIANHDKSKYSEEEFNAYGEYFYGSKQNVAHKDDKEFKYAWLHHQHNNPHHWQYWLLKEDEGKELEALDMPYKYIVEMVCDWWSFSINNGNLQEIQDWYRKQTNMILSDKTRKTVEDLLAKIATIKEV